MDDSKTETKPQSLTVGKSKNPFGIGFKGGRKTGKRNEPVPGRDLSVTQLARVLQVCPKTIHNWDAKKLIEGAYRLPNIRRDRRFPPASVVKFLRSCGFTVPPELTALVVEGIVCFATDQPPERPRVFHTTNLSSFGVVIAQSQITRAVIGDQNGLADAAEAVRAVTERFPSVEITLLVGADVVDKLEGYNLHQYKRIIAGSYWFNLLD